MEAILAIGSNGELGYQNGMPWPRIKADMQWFVAHTAGKELIVGSTTYATLPPSIHKHGRSVSPISKNGLSPGYVESHGSVGRQQIVIGGKKTYETFWPYIDKVYLTMVDLHIAASDVNFDLALLDEFSVVWSQQSHLHNIDFQILVRDGK